MVHVALDGIMQSNKLPNNTVNKGQKFDRD